LVLFLSCRCCRCLAPAARSYCPIVAERWATAAAAAAAAAAPLCAPCAPAAPGWRGTGSGSTGSGSQEQAEHSRSQSQSQSQSQSERPRMIVWRLPCPPEYAVPKDSLFDNRYYSCC
jgi:hypothetical protein